jgi:hypothetical protein
MKSWSDEQDVLGELTSDVLARGNWEAGKNRLFFDAQTEGTERNHWRTNLQESRLFHGLLEG